jgi:hypothetical protein
MTYSFFCLQVFKIFIGLLSLSVSSLFPSHFTAFSQAREANVLIGGEVVKWQSPPI